MGPGARCAELLGLGVVRWQGGGGWMDRSLLGFVWSWRRDPRQGAAGWPLALQQAELEGGWQHQTPPSPTGAELVGHTCCAAGIGSAVKAPERLDPTKIQTFLFLCVMEKVSVHRGFCNL